MTTEEALREAARFAESASALYRYKGDAESELEAETRAGVAAQISQAFSQLVLAYVAEAQA